MICDVLYIPDPDILPPSLIPDPGIKKVLDPGSAILKRKDNFQTAEDFSLCLDLRFSRDKLQG
jgi:hypothetical protein